MSSTCPSGHDSASDDYCDVCGLPIPAGGAAAQPAAAEPAPEAPAPAPVETAAACPNCQATNPPNALFCEACGYDFTTGSLPRPVAPVESILDLGVPSAPTSIAPPLTEAWVAEVWIDPDWYADQESADPLPSAGVPTVVRLKSTSVLVGRTSRSRGIHPDIDLTSDNGISRRHCQLTTDGTRWWVEDLGSSNGTYLSTGVGVLPKDPLPAGEKREVGPDGRVYLGAWSRIVVRRAQPGEV
ncbi:phosphopeptide-binding protein [Nocardioides sp. Root190]|uniref:FHA domain-containing protein n=1 Tax=Nocardioides sp. Root190 TaxID=1736488 RepID=UPI0007015E33|nr:FHA domain-containing protein [Nocardioides sp. Root190]KRB77183.1 phosphopeptide-binding protein [Nocardioides sp. Root190]